MRTQVGIVGAGPAGLILGRLLEQAGVETVILESRSREYVEARIRAGVLEQATVDALREAGVARRLDQEGLVHHGVELQFEDERHRIDFSSLADGSSIVVYGQTELTKDLIAARLESGLPLLFDAEAIALDEIDGARPRIRYRQQDVECELECDLIASCDGFHGIGRKAIPAGALREFSREYPYGWLGIIAEVPPSIEELVYAHHERGFALLSLRSPTLSRYYLQCDPDEDLTRWSDDRIWEELGKRTSVAGWQLQTGPIREKDVTKMRSYVCEPMRHGQLFLVGDAAHIVPPTGAKGLNLAARDAVLLAEAIIRFYESGVGSLLDSYSEACLRRVWRCEHFSWWLTTMLHRPRHADDFDLKLQQSQLRYVTTSEAAARTLAENYTGSVRVDR